MFDRHIKNSLYHTELNRKRFRSAASPSLGSTGVESAGNVPQSEAGGDPQGIIFGPANIPESSAWWRRRQADLRAISEPSERGTFAGMMTITQNDAAPDSTYLAEFDHCIEKSAT